jgi:tetratricopeptide (TPR) repeat protein
VWLGQCYEATGAYQDAITATTKALSIDFTLRQAYLYRGLSYLELNNIDSADTDIRKAIEYFPNSFDANLAILRISYLEGHYGDAFLHIGSTEALAQTDQQKALVLYWTGLIQEKRGDTKDAVTAWQSLLAMPADVMTSQMVNDATKYLAALATSTPTPATSGASGTLTPTLTATPTLTSTPTPTPTSKP